MLFLLILHEDKYYNMGFKIPISKLTFISDMKNAFVYRKVNVEHSGIHIQITKMTYS